MEGNGREGRERGRETGREGALEPPSKKSGYGPVDAHPRNSTG